MDQADQNIVDELKFKIRKLMGFYEKSRSHNEMLLKENENLKQALKQKEKELADFEEKYSHMKVAKNIASVESPHDAKIKINRIVREIDKCIALLNK
jgi:hypothetical protein